MDSYYVAFLAVSLLPQCLCQSSGNIYDFGLNRFGERRGDWSPSEWLGFVFVVMVVLAGLALSVSLCYYVSKREKRQTYSKPLVVRI